MDDPELLADLLAGLAIAVGLVGIIVPLLPGGLLIAVTVVVWAAYVGGSTAWTYAGAAVVLVAMGGVVKYLLAGRHLKARGIPNRTLLAGGVLGIIGFFVIPVAGLVLGFVLGIYLAEVQRLGRDRAWPATRHALTAVGIALLVELGFGLLAATVWATGALVT